MSRRAKTSQTVKLIIMRITASSSGLQCHFPKYNSSELGNFRYPGQALPALPADVVAEVTHLATGPLGRSNLSIGYPVRIVAGRRSTLDSITSQPLPGARMCAQDPEGLGLQVMLATGGVCGCANAGKPMLMDGKIGLGGELSALLKPFTHAFDAGQMFPTPSIARPGCNGRSVAACLGLRPLDQCDARNLAPRMSAGRFSRDVVGLPARAHATRGLFWWTSQSIAFIARPDEERVARLQATMDNLGWQSLRPILGVHVRRGDTCLNGGADEIRKHKGRTCDELSIYLTRARAMIAAHGYRGVFLATDDATVAASAASNDAFGVPIILANADVDRKQLYGRGYYNKILRRMRDSDAMTDARVLLDDLFLLAACDGFVGKFTSNVGRLALALSNAWKGGDCVVPFESLDAEWCADFGRRTGSSIHGKFFC